MKSSGHQECMIGVTGFGRFTRLTVYAMYTLDLKRFANRMRCDRDLVTSRALARSPIAEDQISNKRPNCDGKHDPPIICHEEKPAYF